MFPSFTGSARPRRQVNLSGRNNNPFAALPGSRNPSLPHAAQNAVAQAQQDRLSRQQERERLPAATKIQKAWRGHKDRKDVTDRWRQEWDHRERWIRLDASEARNQDPYLAPRIDSYASDEEWLDSVRILVQFADPRDQEDIQRVYYFTLRYFQSASLQPKIPFDNWKYPLLQLAKLIMSALEPTSSSSRDSRISNTFLTVLRNLAEAIPIQLADYSHRYFRTLAAIATQHLCQETDLIKQAIQGILRSSTTQVETVYDGFVKEFLTVTDLPSILDGLDNVSQSVDYEILTKTMNNILSNPRGIVTELKSRESLLWLLSYYIFFRQQIYSKTTVPKIPDAQYVRVVSKLISFLANDIGSRIDVTVPSIHANAPSSKATNRSVEPLPSFVRSQILTLINQENVSSLLTNMEALPTPADSTSSSSNDASALASYALTLLRAFPWRGDEIRLWLYRGSASKQSRESESAKTLPAIKYFYQATSRTSIYQRISQDPRETVSMLRPDKDQNERRTSPPLYESRDQQWRVILLFLELYTFVLKVMDDEEFLSGSLESNSQWSWTKQSALTLGQVKDLTGFLKNLAFSMYWNATEIAGIEATEAKTSLADYFGGHRSVQVDRSHEDSPAKFADMSVAGINGMTLAYIKGMVTGVLRMIYERDSRRKFLPRDHWLMTKYFAMDRFIAAVVSEEEEKHKIEESYEGDREDNNANGGADFETDDDYEENDGRGLIGTQHTQQIRNTQRLQRQQHKAARRKYLESVTPRLEILQNMPFFIPFSTRVQIFRQFVALDQIRRRGTADPDEWRFAVMNSANGNIIGRHRAKVRRKNIFEDAFDQYYDLGDGLKEPIQIRFVDEFDTIEEGIDGGGVTKEFLTSVTSEAFGAGNGMEALFVENDQHLLYPNPAAVDERKATLREALYAEGSSEWNRVIRDQLRRYEFLGRIIGKCLYEGILVDIHFAPFFLIKWALTGGTGSATKESSYRANLNDLRDLDEGLYQGLLQLKNYPGNVEDFSLNFAVTDTIRTSPTQTKQITRELRPGGSSMSVTNENRLVYISFIARHRLQIQPHQQTSAFLRGLGAIVSPSWLSMFNQSELQTLIGGSSSEVSVSDLRANTEYGGIYSIGDDGMEHPCIQIFWKVMQNMDDVDRKKVLKFVTSTPRAPLLGFGNLNPRFSIRDSGSDQTRLPSTSTCVNLLKLPIYRDEKTLKERLLYSVNSGAGFNLS